MTSKQRQQPIKRPKYQHLAGVIILVLLLVVLMTQASSVSKSLIVLKHQNSAWSLAALGMSLATYFAAAAVYKSLVLRPVAYKLIFLVQVASMFTNRLLPAGIGALGTNYQFLRKQKHTAGQALTIVSVNNLLGLAGNLLLLAVVAVVMPVSFRQLHTPKLSSWLLLVVAAGILLLGIIAWQLFGKQLLRLWKQINIALRHYKRCPHKLLIALVASLGLTLSYSLCLYFAAQAVGLHFTLASTVLCMTAGVIGSTALPTPGGVGGAEAGLVASLIAFGSAPVPALATALLYRMVTYWLPLVYGGLVFIGIRHRHYL